ncbi:Serine-type carboxypeptidase F [Fusarium oxysporum f. sp. albedinis]|nr:Serine-type carboxypeptidase F [Fusarium oxysporum f. sp. albedinis]
MRAFSDETKLIKNFKCIGFMELAKLLQILIHKVKDLCLHLKMSNAGYQDDLSKRLICAMIGFIPAICLAIYIAKNITIKQEGIVKIQFVKPNLRPRLDLSDVKGKASEVLSTVKDVATKAVSEAASKETSITSLLEELPKEITLGSQKLCIRYKDVQCRSIPSNFNSWFPEPVMQLISHLSDNPNISRAWTQVDIQDCIVAIIISLSLCCILIVLIFLYPSMLFQKYYRCLLVLEVMVFTMTSISQITSLIAIYFIHRGLTKVSLFHVSNGKLSFYLMLIFFLTCISIACYIWHRIRIRKEPR